MEKETTPVIKRTIYSTVTEDLTLTLDDSVVADLKERMLQYVPTHADMVLPELDAATIIDIVERKLPCEDLEVSTGAEPYAYTVNYREALMDEIADLMYDWGDYNVVEQDSYDSDPIEIIYR